MPLGANVLSVLTVSVLTVSVLRVNRGGGIGCARGWRLPDPTLYFPSPPSIARVRVYVIHPIHPIPFSFFIGSRRLYAPNLLFSCYSIFVGIFYILRFPFFPFCFYALSLELWRCSSDIFLSSKPRTYRIIDNRLLINSILLGMVETRSVNVKNTHTHKYQHKKI